MTTLLAIVGGRSFGSCFMTCIHAAALKLQYRNARLIIHADPKSRDALESLCLLRAADYVLDGRDLPLSVLNTFWSDAARTNAIPIRPEVAGHSLADIDHVLLPSMVSNLDHVPEGALLGLPPGIAADAEAKLIALGLDRKRWFAVVHAREDGYKDPDRIHPRSVTDFSPYQAAIDHIIDELGGQVVRLGDASMEPLPPREGLIDLAGTPRSLMLQCFAISRARFFLGADSGPIVLGRAFDVPTAITNMVTLYPRLYAAYVPKIHVLATKQAEIAPGEWVRDRTFLESGRLREEWWHGRHNALIENSAEDMLILCDHLHTGSETDGDPWPSRPLAAPGETAHAEFTGPDLTHSTPPVTFLSEIGEAA
jgi:putative glycosyltransferase (TIGR04372 family)